VKGVYFLPVQTGPKAHPAFSRMGAGSSLGIKRPGSGAESLPPSSVEIANGLKLCLRLPSVPAQVCHGLTFTFAVPNTHTHY
jgi:hypothetical protein